jgi:hypothetical protein
MQIIQPMNVVWELDDTHPLVLAFFSMTQENQDTMLNAMMGQFVATVNDGGTWARFSLAPAMEAANA